MATLIGTPQKSMYTKQPDYELHGTPIAPAIKGTSDAGVPFEIQKAIPFVVIEGDPAKGTQKVTNIDAAALRILQDTNRAHPGGRPHKPIDHTEAARLASQVVPSQPAPPPERSPLLVPVTAVAAASPLPPAAFQAEQVLAGDPPNPIEEQVRMALRPAEPAQERYDRENPAPIFPKPTYQPKPKTPPIMVKFQCAFGKLTMPFSQVFRDGIALVLVQDIENGFEYEPPFDEDNLVVLSWSGYSAHCHCNVHYRMPDGKTAHTIFIIDAEATEAAFRASQDQ